jgi:hypothetical protein
VACCFEEESDIEFIMILRERWRMRISFMMNMWQFAALATGGILTLRTE